MNFHQRIQQYKTCPETSSAGSKWTEQEEKLLIQLIQDGCQLDTIAKKHKRTEGAIMIRIKRIAV